jgi:hypothetical protein
VSSTLPAQTCDGCNGIPWDPVRCACVSTSLPVAACRGPSGTSLSHQLATTQTVCRAHAHSCICLGSHQAHITMKSWHEFVRCSSCTAHAKLS